MKNLVTIMGMMLAFSTVFATELPSSNEALEKQKQERYKSIDKCLESFDKISEMVHSYVDAIKAHDATSKGTNMNLGNLGNISELEGQSVALLAEANQYMNKEEAQEFVKSYIATAAQVVTKSHNKYETIFVMKRYSQRCIL